MKKLFLAIVVLCVPAVAKAGLFSSGGSPDYSNNAGNTYICASTGPIATQAGVSISSPPISLYNPVNSGKNLVLLDVGVDFTAAPAAAAGLFLAYNVTPSSGVQVFSNSSSPPVPSLTSAYVGKSTSTATTTMSAKCTELGFLPAAPIPFRFIGGTTGAAAISGVQLTDLTQGKVVIPPGGLISIQSTSAAIIESHFTWREDNL